MMLQARNIGEPQIQLLGIVLLGKFQKLLSESFILPDKIMGIVTFVDGSE